VTTFLSALITHPDGAFALRNERTGQLLASRLESAFDSESRRRGLLGREGLDQETALVIAPSSAVHTVFMRFSIDVIFAARDGCVLKVRHRVPPWRIAGAWGAFAVVELAAGSAQRAGLERGDLLQIFRQR
jgi:uncharacterized protein